LDAQVLEMAQRHLPKRIVNVFDNPRVKVTNADARYFVKRTKQKYDVIIINLPDPNTALINRYYTVDFFKEAHNILSKGGILSLSVSSSENYLNEETRSFLRSINTNPHQNRNMHCRHHMNQNKTKNNAANSRASCFPHINFTNRFFIIPLSILLA